MYNLRRFQRLRFQKPLVDSNPIKYGAFGAILFSAAPFVKKDENDKENKSKDEKNIREIDNIAMKTEENLPVLTKEEAGGLGMMDRMKRRFDEKYEKAIGTYEEAKARGRESMELVNHQRKDIQSESKDKINQLKENVKQMEKEGEKDKKEDVKSFLHEKVQEKVEEHDSQMEQAKHAVTDTLETIKHKGSLMVQQAKDFLSGTAEAAKQKGEDIKEGISSSGEKVAEKGSEMYQGAKEKANQASETVQEKADDAKKGIQQSAQKAKDLSIGAKETAKDYAQRAQDSTKQTMDSTYNKAKETKENLKEKTNELESKAKNQLQNPAETNPYDTSRDRESREKLKQSTNAITRSVTNELPSTRAEFSKEEETENPESTLDRLKKPVMAAKEGIVGVTELILSKTDGMIEAAGDSIYRLTHSNPEDIRETSEKVQKELNQNADKAMKETEGERKKPALSAASEAIHRGQQEAIRTGKDYRQAVEDELEKIPKEEREGLMKVTTKEKQQVEYPRERMIPQDSIRERVSTIDKMYESSGKSHSASQLPELRRRDLVERRSEDEPKMVNRMNKRSGDDTNKILYKDKSVDESGDGSRDRSRQSQPDRHSDTDRSQDRDSGLLKQSSDPSSPTKSDESLVIRSRDLVDQPPKRREYDAYGRKSPKPAAEYVNYVPHPDLKQSGLPKKMQEEKSLWEVARDKTQAATSPSWWLNREIDLDEEKRKAQKQVQYARENVRDDDHPRRGLRQQPTRDYSDYDRSYWQKTKEKIDENFNDDNSYIKQGLQKVKDTFSDTFDTAKHYGEEAKEKLKGMYQQEPSSQYAEDQDRFKENMRRNFQYGDRPYDQNREKVEDRYEDYHRSTRDDSFVGKIRAYFRGSKVADWWENRESGDYSQSRDDSREYERSEERSGSNIPNSRIPATTSIPAAPNPYVTGAFRGMKEMRNTRTS